MKTQDNLFISKGIGGFLRRLLLDVLSLRVHLHTSPRTILRTPEELTFKRLTSSRFSRTQMRHAPGPVGANMHLATLIEGHSMKALFYPEWGRLETESVPDPVLNEGEVLVRVASCGICGSELDTFRNRSPRRQPPLVMGHEFCGWIEASRGTRTTWIQGEPVIAHAIVHCEACPPCRRGDTNLCLNRQVFGMNRPGAFAEYVAVPEQVLVPWPDSLSADLAIFAEPLANGINALRQGSTLRKSRVVIIGAGPIGLMCLVAARLLHGSDVVISDRIPERLAVARLLGAGLTVDAIDHDLSAIVKDRWNGELPEYVIDAVGNAQTKSTSLTLTDSGGTAVWVGLHEDTIHLSTYPVTLNQKTVAGTYSGSMSDLKRAVGMLSAHPLDLKWTSPYPLERGQEAFYAMLQACGKDIKGIIRLDDKKQLNTATSTSEEAYAD